MREKAKEEKEEKKREVEEKWKIGKRGVETKGKGKNKEKYHIGFTRWTEQHGK